MTLSGYASFVVSRSRDAEYDANNRRELRQMERNGGLYALAGVALGAGAYLTSGIPRYVLAALGVFALLAGAWDRRLGARTDVATADGSAGSVTSPFQRPHARSATSCLVQESVSRNPRCPRASAGGWSIDGGGMQFDYHLLRLHEACSKVAEVVLRAHEVVGLACCSCRTI
jgi:hypothetical protein